MKEIKFMAWDKIYKKIFPVSFLDWDGNTLMIKHIPRELNDVIDYEYRAFEQVELIQFIGLYGKNGKEIYEGGIVEFPGGMRREIIFCEGAFRPRDIPDKFWWIDCWVVGNIYENPELLEGLNK